MELKRMRKEDENRGLMPSKISYEVREKKLRGSLVADGYMIYFLVEVESSIVCDGA
jgi:hypothetical protein